jgi:hypothetical protein
VLVQILLAALCLFRRVPAIGSPEAVEH